MKTILLAEDQLELADLLSAFLTDEGYRVVCARDGVEALRALEAVGPDLVLCDIMMPRLSGLDVCRRIAEHPIYHDLPVVLMTAAPERLQLTGYRHVALLYKPFDLETLAITISEFIGGR